MDGLVLLWLLSHGIHAQVFVGMVLLLALKDAMMEIRLQEMAAVILDALLRLDSAVL